MSHSPIFNNLARAMRIAQFCERNKITTSQGLEQIAVMESRIARWRVSRREFLALSAASTLGAVTSTWGKAIAAPPVGSEVKVGIVGAGLAGLACANELKKNDIMATLYDANDRVGGRCFSMGGSFGGVMNFPHQVVERGGEFIDNLHS